ncbi:MAG: hypothetical protein ACRD50_06225 [Candidatus Acidiferrales bacterium]
MANHSGAFSSGLGMTWRRQGWLWLIYIVNLILAIFSTHNSAAAMSAVLDHSMASARLVHGFDFAAFSEYGLLPEVRHVQDNGMMHMSVVFFFFLLFVTGGVLESYRRDERISFAEFFEACGRYFWRFFRLLLFLIVVLIVPAVLLGITVAGGSRLDDKSISPMPGVWFWLVGFAIMLLLMMVIRLWFDMAEVHAVVENEHRIRKSLAAAFRLTFKNFGSLFSLYFRVSFLAWLGFSLGLWFWMMKLQPESIGKALILSQLMILWWLGTRLWQRASEMKWYLANRPELAPSPVVSPAASPAPAVLV